ncbi:MAG: PQQ-binding-like beta-propeller repeat protein [Candidatus Hinthialibacter antarcticus]|nr:PQQ-binding-like beta-propeller repeat protein [Candidatus Hinthialibacter antarcticus]
MRFFIYLLVIASVSLPSFAADWPMWRYDAGRSAASPHELPSEMHLQWAREYPQLKPTWDDPLNRDLMQFDTIYEPIAANGFLYFGSNAFDNVTALNAETGKEAWCFQTSGPVRFAPVAYQGNVYFVSDDGYLYCVDGASGEEQWRYRPINNDRKVLGNERLISTWPARGAPVIEDGVVYAASGIWPMMGVFIYALNAKSGEEIWVNDGASARWMDQPHSSPSFASIAPQGLLALSGDKLLIPGGRSVPACFDKNTGKFLYYKLAESGKTGGAFTASVGDFFVNYHRDSVVSLYDLSNGERVVSTFGNMPVLTKDAIYGSGERIEAFDYANFGAVEIERKVIDKKTNEVKTVKEKKWRLNPLWGIDVDATGDLIQAGDTLYAGGQGVVSAIRLNGNSEPKLAWTKKVDGTIKRLIAADGRLFAVTLEGRIYALGEEKIEFARHRFPGGTISINQKEIDEANTALRSTSVNDGYAYLFGAGNGELLHALIEQSNLRFIAVDEEQDIVKTLRERFIFAGLYGKRVAALRGNPVTSQAPPYLAELIVVTQREIQKQNKETLEAIYNMLRPYGGTACFAVNENNKSWLVQTLQSLDFPQAKIVESDGYVLLKREGALPDSDDWTHQYGNIANTLKSDDSLVKLPLGLLWFGGSSNMDVLPRHGHGPPQQVVDGRLFIQGMDELSARDVYTGRILWKRKLTDLGNYGIYYDDTYKDTPLDPAYNQIHIPGANARGTNYVVTSDMIYIIEGSRCRLIDPASGDDKGFIELPAFPGQETPEDWGYIGVEGDSLIAGAGFVSYTDFVSLSEELQNKKKPFVNYDVTSSKRLVVMDRYSGDVRWTFKSDLGFRHNAITVGDGILYCVDKMPDPVMDALKRRGKNAFGTPRLFAFDLKTGDIKWSATDRVFGTWLGYSHDNGVLLEAGRPSRDMIYGEPEGMTAYRAKDGEVIWRNPEAEYGGPCILHGKTIITDPYAFDLMTGNRLDRKNALTGAEEPWMYKRQYGCNYAVASENLLTFRSAAAGFFDLANDGGVGNFGGFKSGCTNTLIAANGVLNAPDYTRTCSCAYQNQTSLAMVHDPEVEMWTYNQIDASESAIKRLGLNLGAPGDRRADNGTLWLEYPFEGGPTPELDIKVEPEDARWFRHHSLRMNGGDMKWVAASGVEGVRRITVKLASAPVATTYSVRLFFMEPGDEKPGERVFDVSLQGHLVLDDFDVAAEAGGKRIGLIKTFEEVKIDGALTIEFTPGDENGLPILCGVELIDESSIAMTN